MNIFVKIIVMEISYYDSNGNKVECAYWVTTENALRREQRKIGQPGQAVRTGGVLYGKEIYFISFVCDNIV